MPSKYRPYYPFRRGGVAQDDPNALERGMRIGQSFGAGLSQLGKAIQGARMDAVANRLMNTAAPPRAGLVDPGVNPATGQPNTIGANVPTAGTDPITGGVAEMKLRDAFAQSALKQEGQRALIAKRLGATGSGTMPGSGSRWKAFLSGGEGSGGVTGQSKGRGGKASAYVAGSGDVENDPGTDNFGQIQTDVDAQYGKGMYTKLVHNLGNMRPDGKGNMVLMKPPEEDYVPDPNKPDPNQGWTPVTDKNGVNTYSLPIQDANYYMQRYNAARVAAGQEPLGALSGTNPNSGKPAGQDPANPVKYGSQLELRSLPYGTWTLGPDGQVRQKLRKPPGTASAGDLTSGDTSLASADTDTDSGLGSTEDLSQQNDLYS